jgi:hypothetical protein
VGRSHSEPLSRLPSKPISHGSIPTPSRYPHRPGGAAREGPGLLQGLATCGHCWDCGLPDRGRPSTRWSARQSFGPGSKLEGPFPPTEKAAGGKSVCIRRQRREVRPKRGISHDLQSDGEKRSDGGGAAAVTIRATLFADDRQLALLNSRANCIGLI